MGINKLGSIISEFNIPNQTTFNKYQNCLLGIDAIMQLYQNMIGIRSKNNGEDMKTKDGTVKSHIITIFHKNINFYRNKILPIWIFDGKTPDIKKEEAKKRYQRKKLFKEKMENSSKDDMVKYSKKSLSISNKQLSEVRELLYLMGTPYIDSIEEADPQCAALCKAGKIYGVISDDWDLLPFGSNILLKKFTFKKNILHIELKDVLEKLDLTHDQFIDLCIIYGTDYCKGIQGGQPKELYNIFSRTKNIHMFLEEIKNNHHQFVIPDNFLESWKTTKEYYKNVNIIDPEDPNIQLKWTKPRYKELEKFLKKFGFSRHYIDNKLGQLSSLYSEYINNNYSFLIKN